MVLIFSKDRAFQLEACLRSFYACAQDGKDVHVHVIWTASNDRHDESYQLLIKEQARFKNLFFVRENSFRADVLATLGKISPGSWAERLVHFLQTSAGVPRWLGATLTRLLLHVPPLLFFVVDDTLFLQTFSVRSLNHQLLHHPTALALSLRLGEQTDYFYMGNRPQLVPALKTLPKDNDLAIYPWPQADGDYAYPLEISSSILRMNLLIARLLRKEWKSPNTLEQALAHMSGRYKKEYPDLLTFRVPRAVSVPLNLVQSDFADNRHVQQTGRSAAELCEMFFQGVRADLSGLGQLSPRSVHIEFDYVPKN